MAGEAAQVYSHAKRHSRFALAEAAEKRLLLLPVENWGVDVSESSDSFEAPVSIACRCKWKTPADT